MSDEQSIIPAGGTHMEYEAARYISEYISQHVRRGADITGRLVKSRSRRKATPVIVNEPVLGKNEPHGYDYKPITWGAFLKLREAAQKVSDSIGYPVYLVGSALTKEVPRDIDISVIIPRDKYEEMFGELPIIQICYGPYMQDVFNKSFEHTHHLLFCVDYHLDIKVCPDTWWVDKPKMLLASPNN